MIKKPLIIVFIVLAVILIGAACYFIFFSGDKAVPAYTENTFSPSASATPIPTPTPEPTPDPKVIQASKENYDEGCRLLEQKSYTEAIECLSKVSKDDPENYTSAKEKIILCQTGIKETSMAQAQDAFDKTHYLEAQSILNEALKAVPNDPDMMTLLNKAKETQDKPELYTGPVYHVFFHSLIVYPELCFTGDGMQQGYNEWMTTVYEFKRMLPEMYDRGYILVKLADLFTIDASGKTILKDLYLPKGKTPLVISIDDVSYYDYMKSDGFAERLVLDDNGDVATLVKTPEGNEIVTRDGDSMPILDDFVKENPDFSWNNAKGVLALTGYEGMMGYNTRKVNPDWEQQKAEVQKVVDRLKATGWEFACHSYTHRHTYTEKTVTLDYIKYDMGKWKDEVESIIGPTNLYIAPYGVQFSEDDPRMKYIVSQGFNVYCGVGSKPYYAFHDSYVFMERINLDGYKMNYSKDAVEPLFDIADVYDPVRPPFTYK